jgi:hypothetical protein
VHRLANEFGFSNFVDFLRSDHMKDYIDIIDEDEITTYHYPLVKENQINNITLVHQQMKESFLDLQQSR